MPIPQPIIAKIRANDSSLTELNLSRQMPPIADEDIPNLVDALSDNTYIDSLILCENDISFKGAILFSKFLAEKRNIKSLDLSVNKIDDEGAKALFGVQSLRSLDLAANNVTNNAVGEILKNTTLTTVILDDNKISQDQMDNIERHFSSLALNSSINVSLEQAMQFVFSILHSLTEQQKAHYRPQIKACLDETPSESHQVQTGKNHTAFFTGSSF
jgi:Leucine-rich repeat (LRR) protein